jgi:hypothetical protein
LFPLLKHQGGWFSRLDVLPLNLTACWHCP